MYEGCGPQVGLYQSTHVRNFQANQTLWCMFSGILLYLNVPASVETTLLCLPY